jgi:SAM-dependent methyltransferase
VMGTGMDAQGWDEVYAAAAGHGVWARSAPRVIAEDVQALPPGRALDLACGEGRVTRLLLELGWTVTAVDFSAQALALARRLATVGGDRVTWREADVLRLPPLPGHDLVVITYLHLPEPDLRRVLATAIASLTPGGMLLVLGHDLENLTTGAPGPTEPAVLYTPELLADAATGLNVLRCERLRRGSDDPEAGGIAAPVAVDALLVARAAM